MYIVNRVMLGSVNQLISVCLCLKGVQQIIRVSAWAEKWGFSLDTPPSPHTHTTPHNINWLVPLMQSSTPLSTINHPRHGVSDHPMVHMIACTVSLPLYGMHQGVEK